MTQSTMTTKTLIRSASILIGGGIFLWLLFGFFGVQAVFVDQTVNEEVSSVAMRAPEDPLVAATSTPMNEPVGPRLLAQSAFRQGDGTYTIRGTASILEDGGKRTLALTDFDVTNGPDLFVYITSASSTENATVKEAVGEGIFTNIAALKGNKGNQVYALPEDLVLNEDSIVTIWCRRFSRNFGSARLSVTP